MPPGPPDCPRCKGTGKMPDYSACPDCNGTGKKTPAKLAHHPTPPPGWSPPPVTSHDYVGGRVGHGLSHPGGLPQSSKNPPRLDWGTRGTAAQAHRAG